MYGATFISTGKEQLYKLESMHMVTIAHLRTNFRAPRKYMWRHKLNYDVIMASLVRHSFVRGIISILCEDSVEEKSLIRVSMAENKRRDQFICNDRIFTSRAFRFSVSSSKRSDKTWTWPRSFFSSAAKSASVGSDFWPKEHVSYIFLRLTLANRFWQELYRNSTEVRGLKSSDFDLPRLEVRSDAAGSFLIVGGRATGAGWFVWSFEIVEDNEGVKDEDELTLLKDSLERIEADG